MDFIKLTYWEIISFLNKKKLKCFEQYFIFNIKQKTNEKQELKLK